MVRNLKVFDPFFCNLYYLVDRCSSLETFLFLEELALLLLYFMFVFLNLHVEVKISIIHLIKNLVI
ncbi:hypothetical protein D931_00169 [Enterococcus faecium 13.SD.W.09]|nr:hypothetical protein D931_00169 [Enterococcus faecium 13.SD.W.09]